MARIKHIAIRTPDPEKTAAFYKKVFGLEEVGLARSGVYLSDGYINLAILKSNDGGTGRAHGKWLATPESTIWASRWKTWRRSPERWRRREPPTPTSAST